VHGFVGSSLYFSNLAKVLAAAGRRVICIDLYGRGGSAFDPAVRPSCKYFAGQLAHLLMHLGFGPACPVDLVGYSMGGGVVAEFTAMFPNCVRKLSLLAPVGASSMTTTVPPRIQAVVRAFPPAGFFLGRMVTKRLANASAYGKQWRTKETSDIFKELHPKEVIRSKEEHALPLAAVASLAHLNWSDMGSTYQKIAASGVPTQLVWGIQDTTVPYAGAAELQAWLPNVELTTLPDDGHCFPIEFPKETAEMLQKFWA